MSVLTFSAGGRNTLMAALAGITTAAIVKLLLDEAEQVAPSRPFPATPSGSYQQMQEAMRDPLYLADMQEAVEDFAYVDAEAL